MGPGGFKAFEPIRVLPGAQRGWWIQLQSRDHPICSILLLEVWCWRLPACPSIHWTRSCFSPNRGFTSAAGQPRGTLREWAEGNKGLVLFLTRLEARGADMGHPGWFLWALVPLGAALAKGGAVPNFSWGSTFCHLAVPRTVPASPLQSLNFLSRGPNGLALFHASWDEQGYLLECAFWEGATIVLPYQAACAQERGSKTSSGIFAHTPSPLLQRAVEALQERQDACSSTEEEPPRTGREGIEGRAEGEGRHQAAAGHRRVKRGWTMPGTLWCGVGDSAANSTELGIFQGPDLCCRDHDLCAHTIAPFRYNYGIRNYRFHTISHCDCDSRFQGCLQSQQDAISDFVGTTFFNLLEIPCFVLEEKEECIQWYWWGGCKKRGPIPRARLLQQGRYNVTRTQPGHGAKPSRKKQQRQRHRMQGVGPTGPMTGFHPPPPLPSSPQKANISAHPPFPTLPGLAPSLVTTLGKQVRVAEDHYPKGRPQGRGHRPGGRQAATGPTDGAAQGPADIPAPGDARSKPNLPPVDKKLYQDFSETCQCYQHLDQCQHKIEPRETKYQLYNSESQTLFHCNCTRRLAKVLRTKSPNEAEDKLWKLLALTCFELRPPEDCEPSDGCRDNFRAVVVPARHLRRLWKKQAGWPSRVEGKAEERRMKRRRERRRGTWQHWQELQGAVTLYDRCREVLSAM
ncbi:group 3 secretory phospholipase A2 [Trichosurus vulpecula]|uniref:group 3 secretory phospholipase A2 n=1 Tax=Trichosurus vulpecula TaxID=9337 RepID=UPI00186AC526|nr:group 3 secretory phospholipase A2 [Trichosurus vulpecula]